MWWGPSARGLNWLIREWSNCRRLGSRGDGFEPAGGLIFARRGRPCDGRARQVARVSRTTSMSRARSHAAGHWAGVAGMNVAVAVEAGGNGTRLFFACSAPSRGEIERGAAVQSYRRCGERTTCLCFRVEQAQFVHCLWTLAAHRLRRPVYLMTGLHQWRPVPLLLFFKKILLFLKWDLYSLNRRCITLIALFPLCSI